MEYQFAFEKLRVWQNSRELVGFIYKITNTFPKEERYCLVDQIRRGLPKRFTAIMPDDMFGKIVILFATGESFQLQNIMWKTDPETIRRDNAR